MAQESFEQLLNAVKQAESRGQRYDEKGKLLTSPKGAQGEMQVMPKTQRDPGYGVVPAKGGTPDEIARVGRDYLKAMVDKYGDTKTALMAYNWGPGNTDNWLASGADPKKVPAETQKYTKDILGMLGGSKSVQKAGAEPTESEKTMTKALGAGLSAQNLVKDAGPGYKAALAMMFLADEKPKTDEEDIWKEAETPDDESYATPNALAGLDLGYQSPFPAAQAPVARFSEGGEAESSALGLPNMEDASPAPFMAFKSANRQSIGDRDLENMMMGLGTDSTMLGVNLSKMKQDDKENLAQSLMAAYRKQFGDLGLNVNAVRPVDAPPGVYVGGVSAGIPVGNRDQVLLGVNGMRTPEGSRITGYNVGYSGEVGPGRFNAMVMQPKDYPSGRSYQLQYQIPLRANGGPVYRADGSPMGGENVDHLTPQEIERMAAAQAPAFVTPSSGRGRTAGPISQALNSGTAYPAIMRGVGDVAYDIVGGPVDIANLVIKASPLISKYAPEKPVLGSDWIKEKMTAAGIRPADEADPTLKGFRTFGELGASSVNPTGALQKVAQAELKATDMLRRAITPNTDARAAAAQAAHAERMAQAEETMRRAVPVQIDLPFPTAAAATPVEEVRQVAIPKAEPVAPPVTQPVVEAPTAIGGTSQPFVGRLDSFVSTLKGPVTKEQFLNQLKGKFRDYDLQRAETVLSDLGAADKITPAQLTERLSANFSPRDFRIAVHSPEENKYGSFFQGMDNPFAGQKGKNMGVIALLQNNTPERIAAHESNLKVETALSNLTTPSTLGAFMYSDKDVPVVLKYLENNPQAVSNPKEAKAAFEKAQKYFQIALDRQNEIKSVVSAYKYPATHPNWSGYVDEAAAAARASGETSYHFQLMDKANQRVWDEANQWLKKHNIKPPSEEMLTSSGYSDLNKYLEDKLDPLLKEAHIARNKVVNYVKPYTSEINTYQKQQQLYGGDPVHSPLTKQIGHYDPISFSRFTEHKLPMDDGTEVKGIFLHELQSDRMDDLVKKGPKGGSREKDLAELAKIKEGMQNIRAASAGMEPNLAVDAHIMDQAVRIAKLSKEDKTDAARHLYNSYPDKRETITEAFKLANRENELTRRAYSGQYSLPESFAGMETNKAATQQLMLKTAITAAMQRGDNFVAFPVTYGAGKSAQAQLYERLPYNLKQVVKDMGGEKMGFYTKQVKLPIDDATDATTTAVFWGPATRDHVMKTGVPFAKGGSVERVSDDNRRYL